MLPHGYCKVTSKSKRRELQVSREAATTTSGRAKELVKQGLSDRSGMIAFGTVPKRYDTDVIQIGWTSSDSLAETDEASEHDLIGRRS